MHRFKFYWHLFWRFRAMRLQTIIEYRTDFIFWSTVSLVWSLFNFFFFSLLLGVNTSIAGWTEAELYVLLSTFTIIDAFTWSFFYRVMRNYTNAVFEGSLDQFLLKPIDTQALLSISDNTYNNVPRFFVGVGALFWSLMHAQATVNLGSVSVYLLLLCCSLLIIYNLWFIIATLAFYVERLNNINEIIPSLRRVYQVPRGLYQGVSALIFTIVLPLGLVSSIPAEVLLGRWEASWLLYFMLFSGLITVLARQFFRYSISRYSGVGS